ncbi:MAG: inositol-3-phosphate synthase, partial [Gammaproteobacteria bacterium]|nr:inositol-3-phosphate synthase [Gammaproteobacteria bacterium]
MSNIKIAIVGIGNCVSSLIQGIHYYRDKNREDAIGLMHYEMNGYKPGDIEVVAAFDIDQRKVGRDVNEAVFAKPNCTAVFCPDLPPSGVTVLMGKILDGVAAHMNDYPKDHAFILSEQPEPTAEGIIKVLKESGAQILTNYLPVGSEEATRFYANCALETGVAFVNNIPVFIASDAAWARRFADKNLPIIGDDIKSQMGATITHRILTDLFKKRGVKLERTYQLNTGG